MRTRAVVPVVAVAAAAVALAAVGLRPALVGSDAQAASDDARRTLVVTGTGEARGTPDTLTLTLGVTTRAKSAADALAKNSDEARRVIGVLRDAGVKDDDLKTSGLSIGPVYDEPGTSVVAYQVSNVVTATVRDIGSAGTIVDAATQAAGDDVVLQGVGFAIDDTGPVMAEARADAVKRAKDQARQLADAAGVDLGSILTIREPSSQGPVPLAAGASRADAAVPVEPGSQTVSVDVTLVYEIG